MGAEAKGGLFLQSSPLNIFLSVVLVNSKPVNRIRKGATLPMTPFLVFMVVNQNFGVVSNVNTACSDVRLKLLDAMTGS